MASPLPTSRPATPAGGGDGSAPVDPGSGYLWTAAFNETAITDYNDVSYPNVYIASGNNSKFSVITGLDGSGKALRAHITATSQDDYPIHTPTVGDDNYLFGAAAMQSLGWAAYPARSKLVVQLDFRVSSGGSPAPGGCKWFEAWYPDPGSDPAGRMQFGVVGDAGEEVWAASVGQAGYPVSFQSPHYADVKDGAVHRMKVMLKPNTTFGGPYDSTNPSASSRDGIQRLWIDDVLALDCSQSGFLAGRCTQLQVDLIRDFDFGRLKLLDVYNDCAAAHTVDLDALKAWIAP